MRKIIVALLFVSPLLFHGCYYDNFAEIHPVVQDTCIVPDTVSFTGNIMPIFNSTCGTGNSACHKNNTSDGLGLANYADVITTIQDASVTKFLKRINHDPTIDPATWMPKGAPKLSDCNISKIQKWFDQGQQNN